jgi:hypothetical protein
MRKTPPRKSLSRALVLAVLMAGATPAAAFAEEIVTGEKVKGPGTACEGNNASNDHVKVCFQPDGEWIYVRDQDSDGRSAYGQVFGRDRHCRNPHGNGTWARCNYSFREGSGVTFRGYTKDNGGWPNPKRDETFYTTDLA